MQIRACLVAALILAGCGSSAGTPSGSGGQGAGTGGAATGTGGASTGTGTGGTATGTGGAAPAFSVEFPPVMIAPGEEHTQCVVRQLPNDVPLHVGEIHNVLNQGSHHLIVYKTNDTTEKLTPYSCQPFSDLLHPEKGTPLMISQKHDDTLTLPKGIAFGIAAKQFIRLEMHYINTTQAPIMVSATSTFIPMKDSDFKDEADFLFVGDPDINLAPQSSATLGPIYTPLPPDLAGAKFFGFTGHEHQLGTDVTVAITTGKTGTDTPVYDVPGWTWSEPKTVYLDPPAEVPNGGGFHYTCKWNNTTANTVKFGESANNEMCFFWTYYYPSKGAFVCAHTDQYGGFDLCCPGNPLCSQLLP